VALSNDVLSQALARLRADGLVGYPTETVWGLAANASSSLAVQRLQRWKGRAENSPISLLVAGVESLAGYGIALDAGARLLLEEFWPGPLTLIVSCPGLFVPGIARSDGAIGFRCSPHPLARELAEAAEAAGLGPLTATSLNRSGEPPVERHDAALRLCGVSSDAPLVVDAASCDAFRESVSSVLDWSGEEPRVLRPGAISASQLGPVLLRAQTARAESAHARKGAAAPGESRKSRGSKAEIRIGS
jgi:L-threonylcarbamoyladenylate synthase